MTEVDYKTRYIAPTILLNGKACYAQVNDVTMFVNDVKKWKDEEVIDFLEQIAKIGNHTSPPANIAIFLGDVFDAGQRKMATEWNQAQGFPPAKRITMISDSMLIRGALTAYSWLTKVEAKAFAMKDSDAMCKWITEGLVATPQDVKSNLADCFKKIGATLP